MLTHTNPGSNQQAGTPFTFNLNSLFQPIAGGHQPFGFDQMAALYQRYRVNKCKVRVETFTTDRAYSGAQVVGVFPPGSTQTTLNLLTAVQFGENFNGSTQILPTGNVVPVVFTKTIDIAQVAGLTRDELLANVEEYSALVTASPTRIATMEVNYAPNTAAQGGACVSVVTLTFYAEFWQRVSLAQS